MKTIKHQGDLSAKVALSELANKENVYALGAVEGLKGEILILNSKPYVSAVHNDHLVINQSFNKKASLLVYAQVTEWEEIPIPEEFTSFTQLEHFILKAAKESGIEIEKPFPFLIQGKAKMVKWHVINWKDGNKEHSKESHLKSGIQGTLINEKVEIVGFYSNKHHGIFTHHSQNMHLHVKARNDEIVGHLDELELQDKMILKVPKIH
ncbi:decarboxylase [Cytophagales bacterium RKSG123]|nr:decarboxylase [Xanthovirga aplysinae]